MPAKFIRRFLRTLTLLVALVAWATPAHATIALISGGHGCFGGGGVDGGTASSALNTTGADLIVIAVSYYGMVTAPTTGAIGDSRSESWTALTNYQAASAGMRLFYAQNATGGSGHTFTVSLTGGYPGFCVAAFSGTHTSSVFDAQNGSNVAITGGSQLDTGSVTPAANNELVIAGYSSISTGTAASASNMTMLDEIGLDNGVSFAAAVSYEIQTTATARNELFTTDVPADQAGAIAAFKSAAGGGGGATATGGLLLLGVGGP